MRAFLAVDIPETVRCSLRQTQRELARSLDAVRWVRVETIHVTLRFLGEIEEDVAETLAGSARRICAGIPPGRAEVRGLGAFPRSGCPRVIWAGVEQDPPETLSALYDALGSLARRLGIAVDSRPFAPHLTLGRARSRLRRGPVERALAAGVNAEFGAIPVERCTLYRSVLGPEGARHEARAVVDLEG